MEPYAAKSILHNLVYDYNLQIDTFTTDRSKTMRSMIRFDTNYFERNKGRLQKK